LGHVDFFNGFADRLALDDAGRGTMRELIDRKETEELTEFLKDYADAESCDAFCRVATLVGKRETIEEARGLVTNETSRIALDDLERVYAIAEAIGIDSHIDIDLGDVGGLDYYTGLTFKIFVRGLGTALGRGGRYDRLLAKFGSPEPAVGFSICLDWLAQLLAGQVAKQTGIDSETAARLTAARNEEIVAVFKEATRLRAAGRKVQIV
ncbi:MAG TPA: ATP phosphoribosyltransferase regulatory subunit, partial [Blastocatellia bacterium]|nr:ATP phosphoribosyltransferase regulatory subunit [Blastocatellia bacterium]